MELVHKIEISFWNGWIFSIKGITQVLTPILIGDSVRKMPQSASVPGKTIVIAIAGLCLGFIAGYLFIISLMQ